MTGTATTTATATVTPTRRPPSAGLMGVQLFGDEVGQGVVEPLVGARVAYTRVPLRWYFIEPVDLSPPQYLWAGMDEAILPLDRAGLRPLVVVYGNPSWAASTACGPIDRVPLSRYQAFLRALVERYDGDGNGDAPGSPRIADWEIGNEPDFDPTKASGDHGSCFGGTGAPDFAEMLRAAAKAIHQADPTAKVIFGGVAYDRFYNGPPGYSPTGPFDRDFVSGVLSYLSQTYGAEPDFPFVDWLAIHIYNDYRNNWDSPQPYGQELAAKLQAFRAQQLVRSPLYDLRHLPVAVTEVGLPAGPADAYTHRDEALQSAYPGQVLLRAVAEGVPLLLWFVAKDRFTGPCDDIYAWQTFGLMRSRAVALAAAACPVNPLGSYDAPTDNLPKPALAAFRTAQEQLAGQDLDLLLDPALTGSTQIEAYRFRDPSGGAYRLAAFTDSGERLGRRGPGGATPTPVLRVLRLGPALLPDWTGRVRVTDHLGVSSILEGATVDVTLSEAPTYLQAVP